MDEIDLAKFKTMPEDSNVLSAYSTDTINIDDGRYNSLREDLEADARDFEAPTWSLAVDQQYLKAYSKEAIKRQDVIHELIQTEINHVRTLKLVLGIYVRELHETLQMDEMRLERLFPQVDNLLQVHQHFLNHLKQRRVDSMEPGSTQNYCIHRIGDILIAQFSGEMGNKLRYCYGVFCSHHNDAVNFYKDLMQNNKKFQNFIRKISQLSIVRRLGIPEIILLITQRITKYPVLIERVIKNTEVDSEEQRDLVRGLDLLKETIAEVNTHVDEFEKAMRLRDLSSKLEPKSQVKMSHGQVFRREDMIHGERKLLHEGMLNWRLASNRNKDVLVLLLSDVLLLLLEKDQRLTFASLDGKSAVISLRKLIVREAAHDEKAMFLISASYDTPEMYEFHTSSGEERNTWRNLIWKAVECCPEEEVEDPEELSERIRDFERKLCMNDALIEQHLTEKLKLFASIAAYVTGVDDFSPTECRLLCGNAAEPLQGERLLAGALKDVELLQNLLVACELGQTPPTGEGMDLVPLSGLLGTFTGFDGNPYMLPGNCVMERMRDRNQCANPDPQLREIYPSESMELSADEEITLQSWSAYLSVFFPKAKLYDIVTNLSQKLYSLQSVVLRLESHIEVQCATIEGLMSRPRGNSLLEQEKYRNLEKQREELANFQRIQNQHRQEQAQWEQERERQRVEAEMKEKQLRERELECSKQEEQLAEERQKLARCREDYQQDLERLRDSMRAVEKEREKLEQLQKKYKKNENIPIPANFALENEQIPPPYPIFNVVPPGFDERPPLVPPRRESITAQTIKTEVPIHLISTTNQSHKASSVQQKIPTKLAAQPKGKEKHGKHKLSHQRTNSAAGIEVSQVLPIKVAGKEGGSLRTMRSSSPHKLHPDIFIQPEKLSSSVPTHSTNTIRKHNLSTHNHSMHTTHSGHLKTKDNTTAEDIFFF
ncbi:rho guanine nucleotide exchange factor 18a [Myxocyprinus asiaticus]|uniref:rho guanine nucleotide exchange factor 18a n=1 Tax=Myxocyprinus asiaticus TaxID=70543 RepID=UPI002222D811|nr:rho guanine nucleotide exchange factor 18a [Myxocyprinus asiaticus]XP_051554442.1 rho guanine nucleotide exchange factor 18a [Myxocyprinus asiaticus]XP_051554443.1 rho guanine nucleotide exchange factor 18a [Myxocyprinus asiaticus]XP_051554444.1 rho guanine nucleotide exchange factor 18a [Myxocyprinus asiaticus]